MRRAPGFRATSIRVAGGQGLTRAARTEGPGSAANSRQREGLEVEHPVPYVDLQSTPAGHMGFLEIALLHTAQGWMRLKIQLVLAALTLGGAPVLAEAAAQDASLEDASAPAAAAAPFRFEPGADVPALQIPRSERLVYRAYLDAGIVMAHVGSVVQTCAVTTQEPSILATEPAPPPGETASIKLFASGSYLLYELESTLETRILPQEWPRLSYKSESVSSQTRRREILLGTKDGVPTSSYRGDTRKGAPEGTRIWRAPKERSVPAGTLDMLTAVFQARTLIREKKDSLTFPLIDKDRLWNLQLRRGEERRMETTEGTFFDVVEVVLEPEPFPGEAMGDKAERFEGVFGINGSIHLWVERKTGVAVRIQGDLPLGVITLGIDVVLDSYTDAPEGFGPVTAVAGESK
jgi:hypothetical protein